MVLRNFYINVLLRVAFIVLSGILLGIILAKAGNPYYYTLTGISLIIVIQAALLLKKVNKTNDDLEKFLSSILDHDSSIRFFENNGNKSFSSLHQKMNEINRTLQLAKIENERSRQYLKSVVDHVEVGLLTFDAAEKTDICNKAAMKYLKISGNSNLDSLKKENENLYKLIKKISPGQEELFKLTINSSNQDLLIRASELKFENNMNKLVSLEDITNELDKKELESWQKLIRVLTHEIMNSVSPITSLTTLIAGYFNPSLEKPVSPDTIRKTLAGLSTIEETGKGLMDFVNKYRSFTSLPKPEPNLFTIESLFVQCKMLMEPIIPGNVKITSNVSPSGLKLWGDFAQIEQTLINLIRNAAEAIPSKKRGEIFLNANPFEKGIELSVEDNGNGIPEDLSEEIFVPFFTTKKTGSGIGLSLARQIMKNHNGTISMRSVPGVRTIFLLRFPETHTRYN